MPPPDPTATLDVAALLSSRALVAVLDDDDGVVAASPGWSDVVATFEGTDLTDATTGRARGVDGSTLPVRISAVPPGAGPARRIAEVAVTAAFDPAGAGRGAEGPSVYAYELDRLMSVMRRFANCSVDETDQAIRATLEDLCAWAHADRAVLLLLDDAGRSFALAEERQAKGLTALGARLPVIPAALVRAFAPELYEGRGVHVTATERRELMRCMQGVGLDAPALASLVPMRLEGRLMGVLMFWRTIAEERLDTPLRRTLGRSMAEVFAAAIGRRNAERALAHQALHDPLTGLPNRVLLVDRLRQALARSMRSGENVTVMLIDLDGFKEVNDSLGHEAGDVLLKEVAARLAGALRDADSVARLGGDEFVVVAETAHDVINAKLLAARILEMLRTPVEICGQPVRVSASVGVLMANAAHDQSLDANSLLRKADIAMYRAKSGGRDRVEMFSVEMEERIRHRFDLLDDLRRALGAGELRAWYQPIIDVHTGQLSSFEALVRWEHPERGVLPPSEFIDLAEGSGIVHELGRTVLDQAVGQLAVWRGAGAVADDVTMSVNVSVRQLATTRFVDDVRAAVARHALPAHLLHIELTETVFADRDTVVGPLNSLRELGVKVSIDDFGTGYSSLSYLRDLPIDCLKIDRTFIQGLGEDRRDAALVGAVVGMANELGLRVVAEGVETETQLAALDRLGCTHAQGYLFGRPAPAAFTMLALQT